MPWKAGVDLEVSGNGGCDDDRDKCGYDGLRDFAVDMASSSVAGVGKS